MNKVIPPVALGVAVVVLSIFAFQLMPALGYFIVFRWLSELIARDAGIQPYLAAAFAAIFALLFVETVWKMRSASAETRRIARWMFACGVAVYFGTLAFATRADRFIRVNRNGTVEPTYKSINPDTHEPNIRLTEENASLLDGKPANRIAVNASTIFFDSSGHPRLWYGSDLNGVIQFYDKPMNPQTGEALREPTKDVIASALGAAAQPKPEMLIDPANLPRKVVLWPNMPLLRDDGTPRYWFTPTQNRFVLYDRDGYDPLTGIRLQPLTAPLARELDRWMREDMAEGQNGLNDFQNYLQKYVSQRPYDAHR